MREELSTEWRDLRQRLGNLICHIDGQAASLSAEEKRIEERRDESYWNGVQDLYEAVKAVTLCIEDGGMTSHDVLKYFGTSHALNAISKTDPRTIIERVSEWKADKERTQKEENEFHIGDEVIITMEVPRKTENGMTKEIRESKGIITGLEDNIVWICRPDNNKSHFMYYSYFWTEMESIKKTGRHFDSIPFSYPQEEEV